MKKPSSWLVILYDIPPEPSRLKVRVWRDFKRMGAVYPFMSVCILPDINENRGEIERISKMIVKNGKLLRIRGSAINENDQGSILQIFRTERDKQYEEILEECQEFIDEIKLNIKNRKTTQEEVEEMEEVLNGLRRWFDRVKSLDWVQKGAAATKIEKSLKNCEETMGEFSDLSHPRRRNSDYRSETIRD
jgi:Protein ChrB, N-terminal